MLQNLTNQYSISRTLRFELKPYNNAVVENIKNYGIIEKDKELAELYKAVKLIIDHFLRDYNEGRFDSFLITNEFIGLLNELEVLQTRFQQQSKDAKKNVLELQTKLRKIIVKHLTSADVYKDIYKKELITKHLPHWLENKKSTATQEEKEMIDISLEQVSLFKKLTTYFQGFFENRKNIYSHEEQSTAIAYRIVHDNLPRFCENRTAVNYIQKHHPELLASLQETLVNLKNKGIIHADSIDELFSMEQLPLSQKQITVFNKALGGELNDGQKIQGLNEVINLYRQKIARIDKQKARQIPYFTKLYRQILSDYEPLIFEAINNDQELIEQLKESVDQLIFHIPSLIEGNMLGLTEALTELVTNLNNADKKGLWIRNNSIRHLSHSVFSDFSVLHTALDLFYTETNEFYNKNKPTKAMEKAKDVWLKSPFFALDTLEKALIFYQDLLDEDDPVREKIVDNLLLDKLANGIEKDGDFLKSLYESKVELEQLFERIDAFANENKIYSIRQSSDDIAIIKNYLDSLMTIVQHLRLLKVEAVDKDGVIYERDDFYTFYNIVYDHLDKIIPLYNKVRSYITKKPYSVEKFKLNFGISTLASGWDFNKEKDNLTVLFRKLHYRTNSDGEKLKDRPFYCYYLGIMNNDKNSKKIFDNFPIPTDGEDCFEKMYYKLLPSPHMHMPKAFFSEKGLEYFKPSPDIMRINNEKTFSVNSPKFKKDDLHKLIDFYKENLKKHPDWHEFGHVFSETQSFSNISEFFDEVKTQGYLLRFNPISTNYLEELIEKKQLHLLQLSSKDFSPNSHGTANIHTMYWNEVFSDENLKNAIYKLDGGAELFYRPASINRHVTHPKGEVLKPKAPNSHYESRVFNFDLIKNKRFTEDKFQFHVPITLNFQAPGTKNINKQVQELIADNYDDLNIMGIDRGERNLLYISIINSRGEIVHQQDLNIINGVDYHEKLEALEKNRQEARKNWQSIQGIKNLKEGYLSFAVHEVVTLLVKYQAILIMEDLNVGFKRGRMKFERQIYQNFEKALISKLNYLVNKEGSGDNQLPGLRNALQLTNQFESFQKLGKQSGVVFYVPAHNTSRIDPTTGFVELFGQLMSYQSMEKAKQFLAQFKSFSYNSVHNQFEIKFKYSDFGGRGKGLTKEWVIIANNQERFAYNASKKLDENADFYARNELILVAESFKELFSEVGIAYESGDDLLAKILLVDSAIFFKKILFYIRVLTALRYYDNQGNDYILSPVINSDGAHYDSRKETKSSENLLPYDSDGNGAYHIAHKGKLLVEKIIVAKQKEEAPKLAISNAEWFDYMQRK